MSYNHIYLFTKYWLFYSYNQVTQKVTVWKSKTGLRTAEQKSFPFLEILS